MYQERSEQTSQQRAITQIVDKAKIPTITLTKILTNNNTLSKKLGYFVEILMKTILSWIIANPNLIESNSSIFVEYESNWIESKTHFSNTNPIESNPFQIYRIRIQSNRIQLFFIEYESNRIEYFWDFNESMDSILDSVDSDSVVESKRIHGFARQW